MDGLSSHVMYSFITMGVLIILSSAVMLWLGIEEYKQVMMFGILIPGALYVSVRAQAFRP